MPDEDVASAEVIVTKKDGSSVSCRISPAIVVLDVQEWQPGRFAMSFSAYGRPSNVRKTEMNVPASQPDDIWADISYGNTGEIPEFAAFRIFQGDRRISSTTLRREIAVELHRRINRIPGDAPETLRCAVCNATAEEAPPGLRKNKVGAYVCIDNKACIDRMWAAGQVSMKPAEDAVSGEPIVSQRGADVIKARMMKPGAKSMRYGTFKEWAAGDADCILPDNARITEKAIARARKIAGLFAWHNGDPVPGRPRMGELLEQGEIWVGRDGTQTVLAELTISHAGAIRRLLMRRAPRIQAEQAERFYRTLDSAVGGGDYSDGVADALDYIEAEFEMDPKEWMRQRPLYRTLTALLRNAEEA